MGEETAARSPLVESRPVVAPSKGARKFLEKSPSLTASRFADSEKRKFPERALLKRISVELSIVNSIRHLQSCRQLRILMFEDS